MAASKSCIPLSLHSQLHNLLQRQGLASRQLCNIRQYATAPQPRSYQDELAPKPKSRPLVAARKPDPASPSLTSGTGPGQKTPPPPPPLQPKGGGVAYPYLRISVGVVLCGSIIYSMFTSPLQLESPSLAEQDKIIKRESGVTTLSPMRLRMEAFVNEQQKQIVSELEALEPTAKFCADKWVRPDGGGGISCILQKGDVFEKAGVSTSVVYGSLARPAIEKMRVNHKALDPHVDSLEFFASGLSCVLHPTNPNAPTVHFNYRYFETMDAQGNCNTWWFGGGTDLTPSYLFDEDVIHFHRTIKDACDKHDRGYYPRFKQWCDKYFFIPHRGEARGVGGIFFDDMDQTEKDQDQLFSFIQDCQKAFLPSYLPIITKRKDMPFTDQEKEWQQIRRGRYVEFNLVNDRGTSFGLNAPNARAESILMSLPLNARWMYNYDVQEGSREERLLELLKKPVEWV